MSAPEILHGAGYRGPEGDLWALGLILYSMAAGGRELFADENEVMDLVDPPLNASAFGANTNASIDRQASLEWRVRRPVELPNSIDPTCRHLLMRLLDPNPAARATVDEVMAAISSWT
jgi:serine/threonine protein kinase